MLALQKKFATIILLNAILVLFYVFANYAFFNVFNSNPLHLFSIHSSFGIIQIVHDGIFINGNYSVIGGIEMWLDYPLLLFFASTALNMAYVLKLLKEKEPKKE